MRWKQYCSHKCQYQAMLRGKILSCSRLGCNKQFYRRITEVDKVDKCYCSRSCAVIVNNHDNPKRVKKLRKCLVASCNKMTSISMKYCSKNCFTIAQTEFSDDELIMKIKIAAQKLGRTPAKREIGNAANMCIRAFESWNSALVKAGLQPNRSHSQRMYRRTNTVALDGHRCDSISEAIIDNWLTKNRIAHFRNAPYPSTKHKADWGVGERIFIEYFGLAADSPRYDRSIQVKRELCLKHNMRLIEVYAKDLYPTIKLDEVLKELHLLARDTNMRLFQDGRAVV